MKIIKNKFGSLKNVFTFAASNLIEQTNDKLQST